MIFKILTLFPEIFPGPLNYSIIGKALEKKIWNLHNFGIKNPDKFEPD